MEELLLKSERNAIKHKLMLLQQKQKLPDLHNKVVSKESTDNENKKKVASSQATKEMSIRETTFESPTVEDIKQLVEQAKHLDEKKKN